jgi:tetratricopeptide (TPR) repeat protein
MQTLVRFLPHFLSRPAAAFLIAAACATSAVHAQEIDTLPKYGMAKKNDAQLEADRQFIAAVDTEYKGDRKKGAESIAARGWEFVKSGNLRDGMRRFNQAWLLDNANGDALWGMAVIDMANERSSEAMDLFAQAQASKSDDIDFASDYARAKGIIGMKTKNDVLLQDALTGFAKNYTRDPQHALNLQNWAITLYYIGDYPKAWDKIKLAQATPRRGELDPKFIDALQEKMPRP